MANSNQGTEQTRQEIFLADHRRLSRWTPLIESEEQAMKTIHHAVVYFKKIHEIERPQIREELFNCSYVFYKNRKRKLEAIGEEIREGLVRRMTVTHLKKFVERDKIQSEYGVSLSGSKALQAGVEQEIRTKLKEYANKDNQMSTWNKHSRLRDLRMVIDTLPSVDRFILQLLLEPVSASEIVLILESNGVKNARTLIRKAVLQLETKLRSTN